MLVLLTSGRAPSFAFLGPDFSGGELRRTCSKEAQEKTSAELTATTRAIIKGATWGPPRRILDENDAAMHAPNQRKWDHVAESDGQLTELISQVKKGTRGTDMKMKLRRMLTIIESGTA